MRSSRWQVLFLSLRSDPRPIRYTGLSVPGTPWHGAIAGATGTPGGVFLPSNTSLSVKDSSAADVDTHLGSLFLLRVLRFDVPSPRICQPNARFRLIRQL